MNRMKTITIGLCVIALGACSQGGGNDTEKQAAEPAKAPTAAEQGTALTGHGGTAREKPPGGMAGDPHAGIAGMKPGQLAAKPLTQGKLGGITVAVPASWKETATASSMRAAQWTVPAADGSESAELVAYYFGPKGAGGVEANLARWLSQLKQADGKDTAAAAKREDKTVGGMKVTTVDATGQYSASMGPGAAAAKPTQSKSRLLGAIVETTKGPYYFKLVGAETTVSAAAKDFAAMVDSAKQ